MGFFRIAGRGAALGVRGAVGMQPSRRRGRKPVGEGGGTAPGARGKPRASAESGFEGVGAAEEFKAGDLEIVDGAIKQNPAFLFPEARLFEVAERGAAFFHAGKREGDLFAGEVEVHAGEFAGGLSVAEFLPGLAGIGFSAAAVLLDPGLKAAGFDFGLSGAGFVLAVGEDRDLNGGAELAVMALESVEEFFVIIELGQQAVLGDEVDAGQAHGAEGAGLEVFGGDFGFEAADFRIVAQGGSNGGVFIERDFG